MRPGQNKRMRGRPANNRRGPNPLTRSYESNGPDVKIRGNAHHVAEKYLQLARDAHTGGDPVAAENYLQHAEHYFRLIAAAQAAQAMALSGQRNEGEADEIEDEEDSGTMSDRFASPSERAVYQPQQGGFQTPNAAANAPQPYLERQPFEGDRPNQGERPPFTPRQDRQQGRFPDRNARPDRPFVERGEGFRDNRQNRDGPRRDFRPFRDHSAAQREGGPEGAVPAPSLPSFITAGPRSGAPEDEAASPPPPSDAIAPAAPETSEGGPEFVESPPAEGRFLGRGRRRRLRSPYGFNVAQGDADERTPSVVKDDTPISE